MGLGYGLESTEACWKKKNRWVFTIPYVSADEGAFSLPPSKAARPNLSFKEIEVSHLNETIILPSKPEWKPIILTLYDIDNKLNPVFKWINEIYEPRTGVWKTPVPGRFITEANLTLFSGCGQTIEKWIFENCWPQQIDFHDLDMANHELTMIDITLRYARAFINT